MFSVLFFNFTFLGGEATLNKLLEELENLSEIKIRNSSIDNTISVDIDVHTEAAEMKIARKIVNEKTVNEKIENTVAMEVVSDNNNSNNMNDDAELAFKLASEDILNPGKLDDTDGKNDEIEITPPTTILSSEANTGVNEGKKYIIKALPNENKVLIHQLLVLVISWAQDSQNDSSDNTHQVLIKGKTLGKILSIIFTNALLFDNIIIAPTISIISDIINNDPAPPNLLNHFLSMGILDYCIRQCMNTKLMYNTDLLMSLSSLISACCLTQDGINMIIQINPFPILFGLFLDKKYYYPYSRVFMTDLGSSFGSTVEELIRHYPVLQPMAMDSFMFVLEKSAEVAQSAKAICRDPVVEEYVRDVVEGENEVCVCVCDFLYVFFMCLFCMCVRVAPCFIMYS